MNKVFYLIVMVFLFGCGSDEEANPISPTSTSGAISDSDNYTFGNRLNSFFKNGQELCWRLSTYDDTIYYNYDDDNRVTYSLTTESAYYHPLFRFYYYDGNILTKVSDLGYDDDWENILVTVEYENYYSLDGLIDSINITEFDRNPSSLGRVDGTRKLVYRYEGQNVFMFDGGRSDDFSIADTNDCYQSYEVDAQLKALKTHICDEGYSDYHYNDNGDIYAFSNIGEEELFPKYNLIYNSSANLIIRVDDGDTTYYEWSEDCPQIDIPEELTPFYSDYISNQE